MSLVQPFDSDQSERAAKTEPYVPFKRRRPSGTIASGSLCCPACDLPVSLAESVPLSRSMRCPFCRAINQVRGYVRIAEHDTDLNAIELRARLPI